MERRSPELAGSLFIGSGDLSVLFDFRSRWSNAGWPNTYLRNRRGTSGCSTRTIRTTVPLVQVPVSVTDRRGSFVYGLSANDFILLDSGNQRPVHVDDPDVVTAPLAVIVLIQTTDISDSALLKIKKVGSMLSEAVVGANGLTSIITYSDKVTVVQPFTADGDAVIKAFRNLQSVPTRNGHMLDAIGKAVEMLETRRRGRDQQ